MIFSQVLPRTVRDSFAWRSETKVQSTRPRCDARKCLDGEVHRGAETQKLGRSWAVVGDKDSFMTKDGRVRVALGLRIPRHGHLNNDLQRRPAQAHLTLLKSRWRSERDEQGSRTSLVEFSKRNRFR